MGYAWLNYKQDVIKIIAGILEREFMNPNHIVVATEIFNVLHPESVACDS